MSVALDAVGPGASGASAAGSTTLSWTHVCGANGVALLAWVALGAFPDTSFSISSVTLDGTKDFVALGSPLHTAVGVTGAGFGQWYGLANVASGSHTIAVTANSLADALEGGSLSYTGAEASSPFGTPQTAVAAGGTTASLSFTGSAAGDAVAFGAIAGHNLTASSGTSRFVANLDTNTGAGNAAASDVAAGGTVSASWTLSASDVWAVAGIEIFAVPPAVVPTGGSTVNLKTYAAVLRDTALYSSTLTEEG